MYKHVFKRRIIFLLISCAVFLSCCQRSDKDLAITAIEADITSDAELTLSEYFENFKMLKLPSDIIIGEIERIKYENNRIYISDRQHSLFIFCEDGNLLTHFQKRGMGPGEYSRITDFMIDGEDIIVLDRNQHRLLTYDHSGESLSTRGIGYYAQAISPLVDNTFFLFLGNDYSHKLRRFSNGQEDSAYLEVDEDLSYLFIFSVQNFFRHQESIYFFQPFNDTVYKSTSGGPIKPFFYVDFKGNNAPESFYKRHKDVVTFSNELQGSSYAVGVNNFALNDRFLMFSSFYQGNHKLTVFDRNNDISKTYAAIRDDIYLPGLSIPVSQFNYHASQRIIVPLDAFAVAEWRDAHPPSVQFEDMVNATEEEDNPLLLIFDFKQ